MIAERPRHGYELIMAIEERFGGSYSPSPGVTYPTLAWLDDMGYAVVDAAENGSKRYRITAEGEAFLVANRAAADELLSRPGPAGEGTAAVPEPVVRAMANLKLAMRLRLRRGPIEPEAADSIAAGLDAAKPMEQGEIGVLGRKQRQKVAERGEDRQADSPAIAVACAEQRRLVQDLGRWDTGAEQALHRLGDHEAQVMGKPVVEPAAPVGRRVCVAGLIFDPYFAVTQLDRKGRHVVSPQIEGAAACEVEPRVMPMAGEDAIGDRAAMQREAQMRAAIVHRERAPLVVDDEDRTAPPAHHHPTLRLQLLDRPGADEIVLSLPHQRLPALDRALSEEMGAAAAPLGREAT